MDPLDLRLLSELENGLPLVDEPYDEIGKRLNLTGTEILERIRNLQAAGIIRKFRARINQRRVGISANALVAWKCADPAKRGVGSLLASFPCSPIAMNAFRCRAGGSIPSIPFTTGIAGMRFLLRSGRSPDTSGFTIMLSSSVPKSSSASRMSESGRTGVILNEPDHPVFTRPGNSECRDAAPAQAGWWYRAGTSHLRMCAGPLCSGTSRTGATSDVNTVTVSRIRTAGPKRS